MTKKHEKFAGGKELKCVKKKKDSIKKIFSLLSDEDLDQPMIRGFSDDEPLVIA